MFILQAWRTHILERIDLNLLPVLEALLEERSTRRAARRLGVSQPAVSYSLKRLRAHFGDELFRRSGGGLAPTELALSLAEPLRRSLATVREEVFGATAFDPSHSNRNFSIAVSEIGELVLLPPTMAAMRREASSIRLNWVPIPSRSLEQAMGDGTIDILVSGSIEGVDEGRFFQQRLYTHEFVGLIRSDQEPVAAANIAAAGKAYLMTGSAATRGRLAPLVEAAGIELALDVSTRRLLSYSVLLQSDGVFAIVPKAVATIAARHAPLAQFPLPFDLPRIEVSQYWHRNYHNDAANIWLRRLLAASFMNNDPTPAL